MVLQLTNALIKFVTSANLPFHTINQPALKELLELVAKRKVDMPKTNYFMESLKKNCDSIRSTLIKLLEDQTYVCITADVWSSRAQAYIGMTVHYLTPNFERKSYFLALRQLKYRQTHEVLAATIDGVLREYNLPVDKVTHIITDGCAAFCKAFKRFGKQHDAYVESITEEEEEIESWPDRDGMPNNIEAYMPYMQNEDGELLVSNIMTLHPETENDLLDVSSDDDTGNDDMNSPEPPSDDANENADFFNGYLLGESSENNQPIELPAQMRCMSHLLNLVSKDFQKKLQHQANAALVVALNKVQAIGVFLHRSSRAKTLCSEVIGCVLPVSCVTRWNSRYDSIAKVCSANVKPKINILIQRLSAEMQSAAHLQVLTNADWKVLSEYLRVMTPIAQALDILQGETTACLGFIMPTLTSMRFHISSLDASSNPLLNAFKIAALDVLRERFDRYLQFNESNREMVLAAISHPIFKSSFIENDNDERRARHILREECMKMSTTNQTENIDTSTLAESQTNNFFVSFQRSTLRRNSIEHEIDGEIVRFLSDTRDNMTILSEYPSIKNIFVRFNTSLSSSAPIERVFSQCKLIFRPQRNRLLSDNFERAIFLKINSDLK